ncbi:hypothetical protein BMA10229_0001 [Burkholderia mallei NCTC 10229]|nr:hypothetical protein BMA10229_0001 [Burkholderia mallei NCTC 10229]
MAGKPTPGLDHYMRAVARAAIAK